MREIGLVLKALGAPWWPLILTIIYLAIQVTTEALKGSLLYSVVFLLIFAVGLFFGSYIGSLIIGSVLDIMTQESESIQPARRRVSLHGKSLQQLYQISVTQPTALLTDNGFLRDVTTVYLQGCNNSFDPSSYAALPRGPVVKRASYSDELKLIMGEVRDKARQGVAETQKKRRKKAAEGEKPKVTLVYVTDKDSSSTGSEDLEWELKLVGTELPECDVDIDGITLE